MINWLLFRYAWGREMRKMFSTLPPNLTRKEIALLHVTPSAVRHFRKHLRNGDVVDFSNNFWTASLLERFRSDPDYKFTAIIVFVLVPWGFSLFIATVTMGLMGLSFSLSSFLLVFPFSLPIFAGLKLFKKFMAIRVKNWESLITAFGVECDTENEGVVFIYNLMLALRQSYSKLPKSQKKILADEMDFMVYSSSSYLESKNSDLYRALQLKASQITEKIEEFKKIEKAKKSGVPLDVSQFKISSEAIAKKLVFGETEDPVQKELQDAFSLETLISIYGSEK